MEVSKKPKLAEKIKKQSRHCSWRRADVKTLQNVDETYILLLQNVDRAQKIQKNLLHGGATRRDDYVIVVHGCLCLTLKEWRLT